MVDKLTIQRLAGDFRLTGWVSFWIQLTLGIVGLGVLLFNRLGTRIIESRNNVTSVAPGLTLTAIALILLGVTILHALRYVRFGKQLAGESTARPSKAQAMGLLKRGIFLSLLGVILAVVGYQALAGSLTFQASMQQPGFTGFGNMSGNFAITSLEMFSVLSNTQVLTAHVIALVASLWLLQKVSTRNG